MRPGAGWLAAALWGPARFQGSQPLAPISLPRGCILHAVRITSLGSISPNDWYFCSNEGSCEEV